MNQSDQQARAMDLSRRRHLVQQHAVINGIDYLIATEDGYVDVYLIKPALVTQPVLSMPSDGLQSPKPDGGQGKSLPCLSVDNIIVELTTDGIKQGLSFTIEFVEDKFYIRLKLTAELPKNTEAIIRVTLISDAIDPFFSSAEVRSYFQRKTSSPQSLSLVSAMARLNYRAKDFDTFTQLIETELTYNIPDWRDRNTADMMVMLTEVLAYAGDMLSYHQDVVATEAYLNTARFDLSLQRHCRLLDYVMEKNTTARAWVMLKVNAAITLPKRTLFFCGGDEQQAPVLSVFEYQDRRDGKEVVFESMQDAKCQPEYNALIPYDFGITGYVIPKGSRTLSVKGRVCVEKGQLLALIDTCLQCSPQVVRLVQDGVHRIDPLSDQAYTQLNWYEEDTLIQSWTSDTTQLCANVLLVDRGETLPYEPLQLILRNEQYFAELHRVHIVHADTLDIASFENEAAHNGIKQASFTAKPQLQILESQVAMDNPPELDSEHNVRYQPWSNVTDFLDSTSYSKHVVLDEHQGMAELRFGDGLFGAFPNQFNQFYVSCRITPDKDHQIAAGKINQLYIPDHLDTATESVAEIKNLHPIFDHHRKKSAQVSKIEAPIQHRQRLNLARIQDYIDVILAEEAIANVHSEKVWSGSHEVFYFYLYPHSSVCSEAVLTSLTQRFNQYKVLNQRFVLCSFTPLLLKLTLNIEVERDRSEQALHKQLNVMLSDDRQLGVFAPQHFSFNTRLYASELVEALLALDGVANVQLSAFQTLDDYVGSNQQSRIDNVIIAHSHQVIAFQHQGRRSEVSVVLTGGSDE